MTRDDFLLADLRRLAPPLVFCSLITNFSVLISPLFMMQMLDRVVPSGNLKTLLLLVLVAVLAVLLNAIVECIRDLALGRGARWAEGLGTKVGFSCRPVE